MHRCTPSLLAALLPVLVCGAACSDKIASEPSLSTVARAGGGGGSVSADSGATGGAQDVAALDDVGPLDGGTGGVAPAPNTADHDAADHDAAAHDLAAPDTGAVDAAGPDAAGPDAAVPLPPAPAGMVAIAAGAFTMGCAPADTSCDASEKPAHPVTLAAFYLDQFEVTAKRYTACVQAGKCAPAYNLPQVCTYGRPELQDYPINCVTFAQATAFCAWAGGRLPSEAEWEYAARGGLDAKKFVWGDGPAPVCAAGQPSSAWWGKCDGPFKLAKAGAHGPANGYGLYDMAGNVVEMVADWYSAAYFAASPTNQPMGPASGTHRVTRDLALAADTADGVRVSRRGQMGVTDNSGYFGTGFRCAKSAP